MKPIPETLEHDETGVVLFPKTRHFLAWCLIPLQEILLTTGFAVIDGRRMLRFMGKGHWGLRHIFDRLAFVGLDTMPMALLLTGTLGSVLSMQVAPDMAEQGGAAFVGGLVAVAMVRELGPVMTGFAVIAMAGSAFAAEITVMKSNNQLDALKVLHVDVVRYLMIPRVLATMIALPFLTLIGTTLGILGGMYTAHMIAGIPFTAYLDSVRNFIEMRDIGVMFIKSLIFAGMIGLLCCSVGFTSSRSSNESAKSVTKAVVWSFITMALLDYLITSLFY